MKHLSNTLTLDGVGVGTQTLKTSITIPNTGWVANTGDYAYKLNLTISGVLATDYVLLDIVQDDLDVALAAELSAYSTEYAGGITLYAKYVPTAAMSGFYTKLRG